MAGHPMAAAEAINRFVPGLYIRECRMPKGTLGTSMIHDVEHVFMILQGVVQVASGDEGAVTYTAPHIGVTKPGTRRALHVLEDTIWVTVHPNPDDGTDVEKIVARVTRPHENPAVAPERANQWRLNSTTLIE